MERFNLSPTKRDSPSNLQKSKSENVINYYKEKEQIIGKSHSPNKNAHKTFEDDSQDTYYNMTKQDLIKEVETLKTMYQKQQMINLTLITENNQ